MTEEEFDQWLDQHRTVQHPVRPVPAAVRLSGALTRALSQLARDAQAPSATPPLPVPVPPPLLP